MYFNGSFILLVIACLTLATAVSNEKEFLKNLPNISILNSLTRSSKDLVEQSPFSFDDCFADYTKSIQDANTKYGETYKLCLDTSLAEKEAAEEATVEQRNELAERSDKSCDSITPCKDASTPAGVFECYAQKADVSTMRSISSDASEQLAELREKYRLITVKETKCSTDAKRVFDSEMEDASDALNKCIQSSLSSASSGASR